MVAALQQELPSCNGERIRPTLATGVTLNPKPQTFRGCALVHQRSILWFHYQKLPSSSFLDISPLAYNGRAVQALDLQCGPGSLKVPSPFPAHK